MGFESWAGSQLFSQVKSSSTIWWLEKGKSVFLDQASSQIARDILPDYMRLVDE
jgi:hypothetical protein